MADKAGLDPSCALVSCGFTIALLSYSYQSRGGMCERLKQAVLKTALPERVTGVRIPLPPPSRRSAQPRDSNLSRVERRFQEAGSRLDVSTVLWSRRTSKPTPSGCCSEGTGRQTDWRYLTQGN